MLYRVWNKSLYAKYLQLIKITGAPICSVFNVNSAIKVFVLTLGKEVEAKRSMPFANSLGDSV